jgi:hypothetical protein
MTPNPFSSLLHSRKFWLLILDTVISLTLYFVGKYSPTVMEDVKLLILSLQPVFVVVIGAIAYEDKALVEAESRLEEARAYNERPPIVPSISRDV